ncbi:hypothetical protein DITRI_Ditri02bG0143500 [Diplodiscus trichospermus]
MRSPQPLRNGDTPSPHHRIPTPHFHSTVALRKLRRFNSLILVFRLAAFTFSLASSVFMGTNSRGSDSPHWFDFDAFRFVFAANAIVALYSFFEMGVSVWEISTGATIFPEILQVWFDFGHDQVLLNIYIFKKSTKNLIFSWFLFLLIEYYFNFFEIRYLHIYYCRRIRRERPWRRR